MQFAVFLVLSLLFLFKGFNEFYAFLLGGISALLPVFLFAWFLFSNIKPSNARKMINAFYIGELCKMVLMALLLVICFKWLSFLPAQTFFGFTIATFLNWVAPFIIRYDK